MSRSDLLCVHRRRRLDRSEVMDRCSLCREHDLNVLSTRGRPFEGAGYVLCPAAVPCVDIEEYIEVRGALGVNEMDTPYGVPANRRLSEFRGRNSS